MSVCGLARFTVREWAGRMTFGCFHKFRFRSFWVFLLVFIVSVSQTARGGPLDAAADRWVDAQASQSASDILRDIEKQVGLDPDVKANLKNTIKGYLKDKLKKSLLPSAHSLAMQEIVDSIERALNGKGRGACRKAAANQAYFAASQVNRVLSGAAVTAVDLFESTIAAPAIVESLASSVTKHIAKTLLDKIRQELEGALDRYLKNYKIETFSSSTSTSGCSITMRVIWNKAKGRFRFAILGDCKCNRVAYRGRSRVKLARWSVTGSGRARWIGERAEKRNERRLVPVSAIRGRPQVLRIRIKAACCRKDGVVCIREGEEPWVFVSKPKTPREKPKPKRPRTGGGKEPGKPVRPKTPDVPRNPVSGEPLGADDGNIEIPKIPKGPLCPKDKQKVIDAAGKAFARARDNVTRLERDHANASGDNKDRLRRELDAARKVMDRAGRALGKSYEIPETGKCRKAASTGGHSMVPDRSGKKTALAMTAVNRSQCKSKSGCVIKVTFKNSGPALISGVLPLVMRGGAAIASLRTREKGWFCATRGRNMSCYRENFALEPGQSSTLTLNIRFGGRPFRHKSCFKVPDEAGGERSGDEASNQGDDTGMVMMIQQVLRRLNYKVGVIDGIAGQGTYSALESWQGNYCPVPEMMGYWEIANALFEGALLTGDGELHCVTTSTIGRPPVTKRENRKTGRKTRRAKSKRRVKPRISISIGIGIGGGRRHRRDDGGGGE